MIRTTSAAALVTVLLPALPAAEVRLQNLSGGEFEPGKLKLPLVVTERSGMHREGTVVTGGVPFPAGFLNDIGRLGVIDKHGKPVVSQATLMVKWHRPAYDDSVQWALVSLVADVPANGTSTYYLTDDGKAVAPASPLRAIRGDRAITIETGAATFVVPLAGKAIISSVAVGGESVIGGEGLKGVIAAGNWPDRGVKEGDRQVAVHDESGITIEESGPARAVVCIRGIHTPGDKDGKFYEFTARLYFDAGSPSVRIIYTIANNRADPRLVQGMRPIFTWPIADASLVCDLALAGAVKASALAEDRLVTAPELLVYQDSSGGEKWKDLGGGNYEAWLSGYTKGRAVRGVTFRGFRVSAADKELAAGNNHSGVLDVSGENAGVTAALRNFRVEYPHAIAGSARRLRIGLFPGEFSEPFHLNNGQRKSWDVRLTLHGKEAPDLGRALVVQDCLLLFRPAPAWMVRAGAAGAWPCGLALVEAPQRPIALRRDNSKLDGIQTGWDWYGWISSYNAGGGHWNEETVFLPWVLWGDGACFDESESRTLWSADLTAIHFDDPDIPALWLWLMDWNDHEPRIRRDRYPGWYNRDTWGLPDSGHMGMLMWPEYYFLTGDMRAREAIEHLGQRARAMLWQYNHDDRSDGTGPMASAVSWCRKQDPDVDPSFRLSTRYKGWPLFDLANAYRLSGDPRILAECRTIARAFRNTARYSPIGFMVLDIEPKGGNRDLYAFQGPFEKYRDLSASQCYAHFQEGLMVTGLIEYYLMSRDIEALDPMIGFADLMCHHCMLRDPRGERQGWTYAFGDYWGPYTWEDCGGKGATFHVSNFTVTEGLGWLAQFTGRADVLDVLRDAVARPGGGFNEAAALQAVLHPRVDQGPPAAIADLKAESLGGGKVRLTWTAPADDGKEGRAARYHVKYSTALIVERVKGWPDRTPPLPATKEEWEARAASFNARQRAFWAAETAPHAPAPGPAGTFDVLIIEHLPAGTYHFAIKSFDCADNLSALSNVVMIEVES